MSIILTCNAGSTNTKLAAFDRDSFALKGHVMIHNNPAEVTEWLCSIGSLGIAAIGHRIVHGGQEFPEPARIDDAVMATLKSFISLAPLHQHVNLKLVEETRQLYPDVPHIACFDTAFHHSMPELERRLPLPRALHDAGIMRYGFHGLSYQHIADVLPEIVGSQAAGRVIVVHLGGGASACAMKGLKSIATTMGFSTLDGLMMGTRSGALDAGVVLHLQQQRHYSVEDVSTLLYQQSGLKGVSGISGDMQELQASQDAAADEAIALYCHSAAKQIAGLLPSLGGLDMLVFTGGIGENATFIRERIVELLGWLGDISVHVIATNEELVIARACKSHL